MISTEMLPWVVFNVFILTMLFLDLFVFHRKAHTTTMKEAFGWTAFWISLALFFNVYIYYTQGYNQAINFLTAYLIEESLSVDNLFVFILIFKYFQTPSLAMHKVLFYGVLGAIVMRAIFIWLGIALLSFHWVIYLFGAFLIFTGIKLGLEKDAKMDPEQNPLIKLFRRFFSVTENYEGDKFFVLRQAKYIATPLFIVLLSIETIDLVFAIDSIPAVLSITTDPFIVYTSNIFAILGLRSLFFVLSHLLTLFHYLHYAISFILVFVGTKMLISDIFKINNIVALGVVVTTLLLTIVLSVLFPVAPNDSAD